MPKPRAKAKPRPTKRAVKSKPAVDNDRLWRLTADAMPALVAYIGKDCRYRLANARYQDWLGVDPAKMPGQHVRDVVGKAAWLKTKPYFDRALAGKTVVYEAEMVYAVTKPRWMHVTYTPNRDAKGKVVGVAILARDISGRKQAQARMAASEARFRSVLANSSDVIYRLNLQTGRFEYISPAVATVTGFTPEELIALEVTAAQALIHPEDRPAMQAALSMLEETGKINVEYRQRTKAGNYLWLSNHMTLLRDSAGRPLYRDGNIRDITMRKRAEEQVLQRMETMLHLTEQEFRFLAESMPQIVWATRPDGWNIYFNQQWVDYTGMTLEESYGHGWNKPFHPDDKQRAWEAWQRATQQDEPYSLECRLRRHDGVYRWWLIRGEPMRGANGEILKWFGTCTDIEDLKNNEAVLEQRVAERTAALQESEQHLALAASGAHLGLFDLNIVTGEAVATEQHFQLIGLRTTTTTTTTTTLSQKYHYSEWAARVHPDDLPPLTAERDRCMATHSPFETEYRVVWPDGSVHWLMMRAVFQHDTQEKPQHMLGVIMDITARKQSEAALLKSEALLRAIADNSPDPIFLKDRDSRLLVANPALLAAVHKSADEVLGKTDEEFYDDPAIGREMMANDRRVMESGQTETVEELVPDPSGGLRTFLSTKTPYRDAAGNVIGIVGIARDITERKQIEVELEVSRERLSLALLSARMATFDWDIVTNQRTWSAGVHRLLGTVPETFTGSAEEFFRIIHPDDRSTVQAALDNAIATGVYETEYRAIWPDGSIHHIAARGKVHHDTAGQAVLLTGVCWDITERKTAEAALRTNERLLQDVMNSSTAAVFLKDVDGRFLSINATLEKMLGMSRADLKGKTDYDIAPKELADIWRANDNQVLATGRAIEIEEVADLPDGHHVFLANKFPLVDAHGKIYGVGAISHDITARKQAEEQIKVALVEKEVLLKEIHHRVKNNLQIISSLVSLQADSITDEECRAEFDQVRDRVRAMALVHETLYQTDNLAKLDFAEYANRLLGYLWDAHRGTIGPVQLKFAVASVILPVETVVPCGLILNELSTNALKHAFPNGRAGTVMVAMEHAAATGMVSLRVQDDGVGLPAGMDWRKAPSLGLRLLQMLATQLHGTVETGPGPGTEFRVNFKLP